MLKPTLIWIFVYIVSHVHTDFVDDLQSKLKRAKEDWSARLEDFTARISSNERPMRTLPNPLAPLTPFRVLLQLFAYEDVIDNGKLDTVFDLDDGDAMTFFVPQLLSFLLHGAFLKSEKLEEWILAKCRSNVHFAHRCYWFLRAWCLEVPVEAPVVLSRSNSESNLGLAPFLDEPVSPEKQISCNPRRASGTGIDRGSRNLSRAPEKLLPEERAMIERLMLRVKECGEEAAQILAFGEPDAAATSETDDAKAQDASSEDDTSHTEDTATERPDHISVSGRSPSELMAAAESGSIPIHPNTGFPSVQHLDSISAPAAKLGFFPVQGLRDSRSSQRHSRDNELHSETEQFDKSPQFLDALIFLADSLFQVPAKNRKEELRKQLRMMECELLPSNAIYVPIGNVHHRVWRIVADESIPLGTKERVPCIVCLEVVDYTHKRYRPKAWSFLDRLPRPGIPRTTSGNESPEPTPLSPRDPRSSPEGVELPDLKTEMETINDWRFSKRDPLRRTSIFDKVTSGMRDSMKGSLDKMKAQVLLHPYRERSTSDELRSLTGDSTSADVVPNVPTDLSRRSSTDLGPTELENGLRSRGRPSMTEDRVSMSRVSSTGSLASMGQWKSPQVGKTVVRRDTNDSFTRRLADSITTDSDGGSLPYGSDHEEDPTDIIEASPSVAERRRLSQISGVSRPPVVFRESWESKQERIRQKSAYGSAPGWRLLPVLIKANDDLRQEQLASQLIYRMAAILAREKVPVWLCPYEILALTDTGGIIEAIPDTISLDSLKRNDPNYRGLKWFFLSHFGDGTEEFADAQANFVESLAAYSIVCFLLQIKDRHNGNILLDNRGHIIHIDFGFFFLSSPGKNVGFESAPFKLTRDFVEVLGGPNSRLFRTFRELCVKTFITLRRHCMEIILMVEMLKKGNEELNCFRGRPDEAIEQLQKRFRLDLNDRACREYVNFLIDDSIENWRTDWYDRYQRYFVGVL